MNMADRKHAVEKKFNEIQDQRNRLLEEMHRLQGEYRLLEELEADPATTIKAIPAKEK